MRGHACGAVGRRTPSVSQRPAGGELPLEQHQRVKTHLEKCPPCLVYLETYTVTIKLTRQLPCAPLPAGLRYRLEQALQGLQCRRPEPPGWRTSR